MAQVKKQSASWIATAPIQINRKVTMQASPTKIWDVIADNEGWPEWFPGFKSCAFEGPAPHHAGSIRALRQDQFKVRELITAWEPGQSWGMSVIEMNVPLLKSMAEIVELRDVGNGATEVDWRIGVEMRTAAKLLKGPLVKNAAKGLDQALENLSARASR